MYLYLRNTLFILLAVITCQSISAQQKLSNYLPASPNAASLTNGGGMGVNMSTGTANISIPIYTAKSGNLQIPVSINYNAQGIKVNDMASSIGLGWALSAGGIITKQNLRGPDCGLTNVGRDLFLSQFESNRSKFTLISDSTYQYSATISSIGDNMYDFQKCFLCFFN